MKRILIVDTVYQAALNDFMAKGFINTDCNYDSTLGSFFKLRFGTSDVYSYHLSLNGFEAQTVIANSNLLQSLWAKENGFSSNFTSFNQTLNYATRIPYFGSLLNYISPLQRIFFNQVEHYQPHILYFQDLNFINPRLLRYFSKKGILILGQIASPLPNTHVLKSYDHIYSSLPNLIERLNNLGISSSFLPIGFDTRILDEISPSPRTIPISFIGGLSSVHSKSIPLLESIYNNFSDFEIYGYGIRAISTKSPVTRAYKGRAWGLDMYNLINSSVITLNRHSSISGDHANNMRMFEATGLGSLLLTDEKKDLDSYFVSDCEVLTYSDVNDALTKITWAIENRSTAKDIAKSGQLKTINRHTYEKIISNLALSLRSKV